jgi:hypothetical protein
MKKSVVCFAMAFFVVAALSALAVPDQAQEPNPFLGSWKGTLSVMGGELEIRFVFSLDEAKKIQGTFDSITQGGFGIKLGEIKIDGKSISFIIDDPGTPGNPTFKGMLDETGKKIAGDFSQSGVAGTFAVDKEK